MSTFILERDFTFSAAHFLPGHEKCGKMHGHNYKVTVRLNGTFERLSNGMVIDFSDLKQIVNATISGLDHTCLNESLPFEYPTAELISKFIYDKLERGLKARMHSVTVQETDDCRVTYKGGV